MTEVWIVIGCLAVVNIVVKATGPVLAGGRDLPEPLTRVIAMAVPALMAALIVTGAFVSQRDVVLDARAAGLAAAAVALVLKASLLVVLVVAAATTALLRAAA